VAVVGKHEVRHLKTARHFLGGEERLDMLFRIRLDMLNHMIRGLGYYVDTITSERAHSGFLVRINILIHPIPSPV
jgi:hypothetical protein